MSGPAPRSVGVLGGGFIAQEHLAAWTALGWDVTVSSRDPDGSTAVAARYGVRAAPDLDSLLAGCAVLDVCTPTDQHHAAVRAAITAGRHVVCEKPLARTTAQARELATAATKAGVMLLPAHVVRYFPEYALVHSAVRDGAIGEPAVLHLARSGPRPTWAAWFADDARSGGLLMDLLVHDYDIARWLAGDVVRVYARHRRARPDGTVTGLAVLTHRGGAVSHVHGAWLDGPAPVRSSFELYGAGGVLRGPATPGDKPQWTDTAGVTKPLPGTVRTPRTPPFLTELAEFAEALCGGPPARVGPGDGVAAVAIAEAACESARTGRAVELTTGGVPG